MREAFSIVRLNESAALWGDAMRRACWQGALAALIVWLVCLCWKRMPSAFRYALWWSDCLKLVLALSPALFTLPLLPPINQKAALTDMPTPIQQGQHSFRVGVVDVHGLALATSPSSALQTIVSNTAWLMIIWLSAIAVLAGISAASVYRLRRIVHGAVPLTDPEMIEAARDAALSMGMRSTPPVLISQVDSGVLTLGALRPVVLLSKQTLERCDPAELKLVLAHEFAHIRRGDAWLGLLPHLTQILFCFHPIAWLACHEIRVARETACDEHTIIHLNARPDQYGRLLLKLGVRQTSWLSLCTPGVSSHYRILHRRLSMLQQIHVSPRRFRGHVFMAACLIGIAAAVPWSVVHAQSSSSQTSGSTASKSSTATTNAQSGRVKTGSATKSVQDSSAQMQAAWRSMLHNDSDAWSRSWDTTFFSSKTGSDNRHVAPAANHAVAEAPKRITTLFQLKYTEAASVAKTLSTLFEEDDKRIVKIVADVRTNTIIIQTTPDKLAEISPVLDHLDSTEVPVRATVGPATIIKIRFAKATDIATTVSAFFDNNVGVVKVAVDERTNSIIVRGPEEQINELRNLVLQLDVNK